MQHESTDTPDVKVFAPAVFLGALALSGVAMLIRRAPLLPSALQSPRRAGGIKLIIAGLALGGWAVRTMFKQGTSVSPEHGANALVEDGPFKYTRNPIYVGMTLIYTGITLLLNNLWGAVLIPPVLTIVRRAVIEPEEHYLTRRFGEPYVEYTRRVRRWL
jgi:protein-S-isoprenylcysteine O-methyltransferase Ste14